MDCQWDLNCFAGGSVTRSFFSPELPPARPRRAAPHCLALPTSRLLHSFDSSFTPSRYPPGTAHCAHCSLCVVIHRCNCIIAACCPKHTVPRPTHIPLGLGIGCPVPFQQRRPSLNATSDHALAQLLSPSTQYLSR
uniref:Uncharacterized protein n=1 Tax=Mycena chlorophos TaxID=658473 RepID=A0ABQ0LK65_MYCCL|nr:predicted protein [Mycena chlorophos]